MRRYLLPVIAACSFLSFCESESGDSPTSTPRTAAEVDSLEWVIKKAVIDSFGVGLCFGMPSLPFPGAGDSTILANPGLADSIRAAYGDTTNLAIYTVMRQLDAVSCDYGDGVFVVQFANGECCTIEHYAGRVWVDGRGQLQNDIALTSTENVPC